jgi:hypothetical protein
MLARSLSASSATAIETSPSAALREVAPTVIEKLPFPLGEVGISDPLKVVAAPRAADFVDIFFASSP